MENNDLPSMEEYGYEGEEIIQTKVSIDYEKKWEGHNEPVNEITQKKGYEILREMDVNLAKPNQKNIQTDIPVEHIVIEVQDEILQNDLGTDTESFFLEFVSVPVRKDGKREMIRDDFLERDLIEQGFEFRILALKSISSEERWFSKEPANLYWGGLEDVNLPYDAMVSQHIQVHHMDDEISTVEKLEKVTEERFKL